jgi:hypothetical protein
MININDQNVSYFLIYLIPILFGLIGKLSTKLLTNKKAIIAYFVSPLLISLALLLNICFLDDLFVVSTYGVSYDSVFSIKSFWNNSSLILSFTQIFLALFLFSRIISVVDEYAVKCTSGLLILLGLSLSIINAGDFWGLIVSWVYINTFLYLSSKNDRNKYFILCTSLITSIGMVLLSYVGAGDILSISDIFITSLYPKTLTVAVCIVILGVLSTLCIYMMQMTKSKNFKAYDLMKFLSLLLSCVGILNILSKLSSLIVISDYIICSFAFFVTINWISKTLTEDDLWKLWFNILCSFIGLSLMAFGFGSNATGSLFLINSLNSLILLFIVWRFQTSNNLRMNLRDLSINKEEFPISYWCCVLAILSLTSIPLMSGFFLRNDISWLLINSGRDYFQIPFLFFFISTILITISLVRMFYYIFISENKNFKRMDECENYPLYNKLLIISITLPIILLGYFSLPKSLAGSNGRYLQNQISGNITDLNIISFSDQVGNIAMIFQILCLALIIYGVYVLLVGNRINDLQIKFKSRFHLLYEASMHDLYIPFLLEKTLINLFLKPLIILSLLMDYFFNGLNKILFIVVDEMSMYLKNISYQRLNQSVLAMMLGLTFILISVYALIIK